MDAETRESMMMQGKSNARRPRVLLPHVGVRPDAEVAREHTGAPREDFVASGEHDSFAIAVDPRGTRHA